MRPSEDQYYDVTDVHERLDSLVGRSVNAIRMGDQDLGFITDQGPVGFGVEGDCCSHSYFYDFYGVRNLLDNGPITSWECVALEPGDAGYVTDANRDNKAGEWGADQVQSYGYRLFTVHPQWGEVSSVFSFRNDSNGYYGGYLTCDESGEDEWRLLKLLTDDEPG